MVYVYFHKPICPRDFSMVLVLSAAAIAAEVAAAAAAAEAAAELPARDIP